MPVADITEARDLVMGMLMTAWEAQLSPPTMFFDDQDENTPNTAYAVATLRHKPSQQTTVGEATNVRYNSPASLVVDIFTPYGDGMKAADPYIKTVQNTFIGRKSIPDKLWFRAVVVAEMPRQGALKKTRVVVNFDYDQLF